MIGAAAMFNRMRAGLNTRAVHAQSRAPFRFLLCGDPALVADFRAVLLAGQSGDHIPLDAAATLETIDPTTRIVPTSDARAIVFLGRSGDRGARLDLLAPLRLPIFAVTVDPAAPFGGPTIPPRKGQVEHYAVPAITREALRPRVFMHLIECCRGVEIAVGRRLPALRETVAAKLTRNAASNALKVSAASGAVDSVPLLGFVLGAVVSAGDMVAITGIQMKLTLEIGAVYGKDPDLQRAWELLPVVGGGFGWRMLSRELAGFIPVAGMFIKSAIAYAGTIVVGESVVFFYEQGRHMSPSQASSLYEETKTSAMQFARDFAGRITKH